MFQNLFIFKNKFVIQVSILHINKLDVTTFLLKTVFCLEFFLDFSPQDITFFLRLISLLHAQAELKIQFYQ